MFPLLALKDFKEMCFPIVQLVEALNLATPNMPNFFESSILGSSGLTENYVVQETDGA